MLLIADSGSTKTDWRAIAPGGAIIPLSSEGINPVFQTCGQIRSIVGDAVLPVTGTQVDEIYFYGAGIINGEMAEKLGSVFNGLFGNPSCRFDSDMAGAARALFGKGSGIACILGTGSNSCFYENGSVRDSIRSGGFILGDEGSGADLGKRLLSDYIKGLLPNEISCEFSSRYGLDYQDIVSNVYRSPYPGRFLASFSPFIREFAGSCLYMHDLVKDGFSRLFERAVARYGTGKGPVGFAGSVAYHFSDILRETALSYGIEIGKIICRPADGLAEYHKIESGL